MDRMKSLLQSYYGVSGEGNGCIVGANDLDSPDLDAKAYAGEQLREKPFAEMLKLDDALVQETTSLDADMQLLVYDNYARFVHATDTIRSMKEKIDQIDGEIDGLSGKVAAIETAAEEVNKRMAPKRTKIEKLMRLQNLIRKLNFLFELPVKLKQCIDMGAPQQAVFYYKRAVPILQKHGEVASFASIERESHQLMTNLRHQMKIRTEQPGLSYANFNESVSVLIDLSEREAAGQHWWSEMSALAKHYLEWHEAYFEDQIAAVSASDEHVSLTAFVEAMFDDVLTPLKECCKSYNVFFVDKNHTHVTSSDGDMDADANDMEELEKALKEFSKPVVNNVLSSIRTRLLTTNSRNSSSLQEKESKREQEQEQQQPQDTSQYNPFLAALNVLMQRLDEYKLDGIIREGLLRDRATEIAEHATRKQVVQAFEGLRKTVTERLAECCDKCCNKMVDSDAGDKACNNAETNADNDAPLPLATHLASAVEADIAITMACLQDLLKESGDVLSEMTAIFDNLVKFQLRFWFLWFANALECFCDPYHPYRKSEAGCGGGSVPGLKKDRFSERARILVDVPKTIQVPEKFRLVLVCLAQKLRSCVMDGPYPIAGAGELVSELDATKDRLLVTYVEACGLRLCKELKSAFGEPSAELRSVGVEPTEVRTFAARIVESLARISKTVAESSGDPDYHQQTAACMNQLANSASSDPNARYTRKPSLRVSNNNVHLDIERMFAENVKILDIVSFASESVTLGVLKIVLKTIFELLRETTLNKFGFQQVEVDVFFLRSVLPVLLQDVSVMNLMLTHIMSAAAERCLDPTPLSSEAIDRLCRAKRQQLQLNMN